MERMVIVASLTLALVACGGGKEDRAVATCEKAVAEKLAERAYTLDRKDMRAKATAPDDKTIQIASVVVFDKGLPAESKQAFECRVRFDPANPSAEPAVIALHFTW